MWLAKQYSNECRKKDRRLFRGISAFEKIVFGSDVFGGELEEFDLALQRYHEMLDACQVDRNAQAKIFSGTMWRILEQQQKAMAAGSGD